MFDGEWSAVWTDDDNDNTAVTMSWCSRLGGWAATLFSRVLLVDGSVSSKSHERFEAVDTYISIGMRRPSQA